jgi:hypothetical protein
MWVGEGAAAWCKPQLAWSIVAQVRFKYYFYLFFDYQG